MKTTQGQIKKLEHLQKSLQKKILNEGITDKVISKHGNWEVTINKILHRAGDKYDIKIGLQDLFSLKLADEIKNGWVFATPIKIATLDFVDADEMMEFNLAFWELFMLNFFLDRIEIQSDVSLIETLTEQKNAFIIKLASGKILNERKSDYKTLANGLLLKKRNIRETKQNLKVG